MAEHLKVSKEEIVNLFEQGYSKKEVKEELYPNIPANMWNSIWEQVGLKGKVAPKYTFEIVEDVNEVAETLTPEPNTLANGDVEQGSNSEPQDKDDMPTYL